MAGKLTIPFVPKIVEEHPHAYLYVRLAKAGLWATSAALCLSIGASLNGLWHGDAAAIGNLVQACQVAAIVSVTVLGWHGYKGQHLLHNLRHWKDK